MKLFSGEGQNPSVQSVHYSLRVASAMCFIGHGAFGIITKQVWCNYFGVFGIGHDLSYRLMPFIGGMDILMGIVLIVYPVRAAAVWLVVWGLLTASLRPLSGEPIAEMIERAGNYGAPLALLFLSGVRREPGKGWLLSRFDADNLPDERSLRRLSISLRLAVFLLLLGHAWLNLLEKQSLLLQYEGLGFLHPAGTARMVGMIELLAALAILIRPIRSLVLIFFVWKMGTELFHPHWELFEWIERGGSYGCLLALWLLLGRIPMLTIQPKTTLAIF